MTSEEKSRLLRSCAICFGLVVLTWIVFGQTLRFDFVNFDDDKYVYDNPQIAEGFRWRNVLPLFTHSHAALWHPLTSVSHMLDCQFYGLRPSGHHLTNVVLHSVAVVLLFLVLVQMTNRWWPSAFVAALFAIHPMRVESVAWIAERKDVLSAVFFMLTLGAYTRYVRRPTVARYAIVAVFVACGLMSKATFVTVPFVLLLLDYWPFDRLTNAAAWKRSVLEKIPLLGLTAVAATATFFAQKVTMSSLEQLAMLPRIKNALVSIVIYIRQMFWPSGLTVFYPHPHDHLNPWVVIGSALLIAVVTILSILLRRKYPYLVVAWLWFLGMLVPVLGIVQVGLQGHADRFTYLPHIGLFILMTWLVADLTGRWRHRGSVLGAMAALVLTTLTICSWRQTGYWRDSTALWTHALAVTSNNTTAHIDLAAALREQGKTGEADAHVKEANFIHWQTVLKDFPFDNQAHDELGIALIQRGEVREAIAHWRASLQIDPTDGNAANNLAWVLATNPDPNVRDGPRALELAERATRLAGGENVMVLRTLAAAYAESGRFPEASETATRAAGMAEGQQKSSLAETLRNEIKSYNANVPYRENPSP